VRAAGSDARDDRPEAAPEGLGQERVEDGVHARVGVGQDVGDDLQADEGWGQAVTSHGLGQQDDVDRQPADGEGHDHDEDHADNALLVLSGLGGGAAASGRWVVPQTVQHDGVQADDEQQRQAVGRHKEE